MFWMLMSKEASKDVNYLREVQMGFQKLYMYEGNPVLLVLDSCFYIKN